MRSWATCAMIGFATVMGCRGDEHEGYYEEVEEPARNAAVTRPPPRPVEAPPMRAADSAHARQRITARRDSAQAAFARIDPLGASEIGTLRQDRNAKQIATARTLGQRAAGKAQIEQLVREGRLVELADSTEYWILRKMDHSVPVVTPDGQAMLMEIGRRFHARLRSAGLPLYRIKVTSALRTDETQAELRKINSYASSTVSAHEFGTTVDVSHERFAVPAPVANAPVPWEMESEMLEELGKEHSKVLQAELGRAITALRKEGVLHVMIEDRQPVYHMTVARKIAPAMEQR